MLLRLLLFVLAVAGPLWSPPALAGTGPAASTDRAFKK